MYEVTKAAICENGDNIPRFQARKKVLENFIWAREVKGFATCFSDVVRDFFGIEAHLWVNLILPGNFGDIDPVRSGERLGELVLKDASAGGVGAGFKESP